jgi:hypothetical protein
MNFFRSEEHLRSYDRFDPSAQEGIIPLRGAVKLFSIQYFKRRLDQDYFSNRLNYRAEIFDVLKEIGKTGPFWHRPK